MYSTQGHRCFELHRLDFVHSCIQHNTTQMSAAFQLLPQGGATVTAKLCCTIRLYCLLFPVNLRGTSQMANDIAKNRVDILNCLNSLDTTEIINTRAQGPELLLFKLSLSKVSQRTLFLVWAVCFWIWKREAYNHCFFFLFLVYMTIWCKTKCGRK